MKEIERVKTGAQQGALPQEEGIEIPLERIPGDILRTMLTEFVTREWVDEACSAENRMEQVMRQLREHQAKVVYDFKTETWNIVPCG